jgi:hypothetical protein
MMELKLTKIQILAVLIEGEAGLPGRGVSQTRDQHANVLPMEEHI